jgi:hypothetical protein
MEPLKHIKPLTQMPSVAQVSNLQIKLEGTTAMIDRLLLADRQAPWKTGFRNFPDDDDDTTGGTGTNLNV